MPSTALLRVNQEQQLHVLLSKINIAATARPAVGRPNTFCKFSYPLNAVYPFPNRFSSDFKLMSSLHNLFFHLRMILPVQIQSDMEPALYQKRLA